VEIRAETVVAEVEERWGAPCAACSGALSGHDVVLSMFLGFSGAPRCILCLASGLGRAPDDFLRSALSNLRRLDCYRAGWLHSDRRAQRDGLSLPGHLARASELLEADADEDSDAEGEPATEAELSRARLFDAGDMSCGDLVLELRSRLQDLDAGEILRVRATDPGAPQDLPAWCRVTGHPLVVQRHPEYWIRRRPR
jgi:tRNA 2-thiouridine synthesizing protein A